MLFSYFLGTKCVSDPAQHVHGSQKSSTASALLPLGIHLSSLIYEWRTVFFSEADDELPRKLWMLRFNVSFPIVGGSSWTKSWGQPGECEQVTASPSSGWSLALQPSFGADQSSLLKGCVDPGFTQDNPDTSVPLWWSSGRLYRNQSIFSVA